MTHLYERIIRNTEEPRNAQDCWRWVCSCDRWHYPRMNVYVPGLGKKVKLMTHLVAWLEVHAQAESVDEIYLAYIELRASGLQLDHLCCEPRCVSPEHVEPVTASENCRRRNANLRRI